MSRIKPITLLFVAILILGLISLGQAKRKEKSNVGTANKNDKISTKNEEENQAQQKLSEAYFGGGCFWCVQAMFEDLKGVKDVESGYSGGFVQNPQYKQVKKGKTGHAQVIKITYNPKIISFKQLLYIFMHAHDPTTYHRQGIDSGSQYRSVIYYQTQQQLRTSLSLLKQIQKDGSYTGHPQQILTQIAMFGKFYPAEKYHQDYFTQNPYDQQCSAIIAPKVDKMKKLFKSYYEDIKEDL